MEDEDYTSAQVLKQAIQNIVSVQGKIATSGARVNIHVTNADGSQELLSHAAIKAILGDSSYNTICGTALTSVSSALSTLKSTKDTAFAAL